jgi:hypothetical protein
LARLISSGSVDILAETSTGLTGSEIGLLLRELLIADPEPSATKSNFSRGLGKKGAEKIDCNCG